MMNSLFIYYTKTYFLAEISNIYTYSFFHRIFQIRIKIYSVLNYIEMMIEYCFLTEIIIIIIII